MPVIGGLDSPDGKTRAFVGQGDAAWPKNIASGGLGCCGFRVLDYAARLQHVPDLVDLPEKMRKAGIAGGAYPDKVDKIVARFAPEARYWQDESKDWDLLEAMFKSKRLVCSQYSGRDPHYHGTIAHCVNLACVDREAGWVAVYDNNYPSEKEIVWMGTKEFSERWNGWAYGLLAATPGIAQSLQGGESEKADAAENAACEWRAVPREPDQLALYCRDRQLGNFFRERGTYFERLANGSWADKPSAPPIPPPERGVWPGVPMDGVINFGVEISPVPANPEASINRGKVSKEELLAAIGPEMVPAKPAGPGGGGGGIDLSASFYGLPLWLIIAAGVALLVALFRRQE